MDNLEALIAALPPAIVAALRQVGRTGDLIEIVMDLGRPPEARYVNGEVMLSTKEIDRGEIDFVVERIGHFGDDNRAGIERTLHRISAIRNRERQVVGLTCRVGRAVYGTIDIIRDIVESGRSVLLLGRPGVGKTTMLREVARVLVPEGRVVIAGLNPVSLWGLRQRRAHLYRRLGFGRLYLPDAGEFIGYLRLRDWLRLLNLEIEVGHFGCYRPALVSAPWLQRFAWMDSVGARWWPILGAVYFLVAVKRVHGMTLLNPAWKPAIRLAGAPVSIANSTGSSRATSQ